MTNLLLLVSGCYFAGSIPFGLLLGRIVKGIDIRHFGSGNIGATNAGRVLGKKWGLICLVLDAFKGLLPTLLIPKLIYGPDYAALSHLTVLGGISTIVGHMFPIWLGFRGGKGVATSLGVVGILGPWGLSAGVIAFIGSFFVWRIVSLSSILAATTYGVFELATLRPSPFTPETWSRGLFAITVPLLIIIQHRTNLRRLIKGEEPKFTSQSSESKGTSQQTTT
ncbi:MAG: glycerol-3-phosphate 1-O-acyltransferase PlsY [Planctomycetes bacterium]|nr:glycerol-3-phosphate 1-O-acyltransferase PlsY [Planctomycetota bacterium]